VAGAKPELAVGLGVGVKVEGVAESAPPSRSLRLSREEPPVCTAATNR
jgi:hypothetical protein